MLLLFKISKLSFKKCFILKAARRAGFFAGSQEIQSQTDKSGDFMSTIAAISTGLAAGGIGIVRISGENALNVADSIFKTVQGIELKKLSGYKAAFGRVFLTENPLTRPLRSYSEHRKAIRARTLWRFPATAAFT